MADVNSQIPIIEWYQTLFLDNTCTSMQDTHMQAKSNE